MSGLGTTACDECRQILSDRKGSLPAPRIQTWEWPLLIPGFSKAAGPVSAMTTGAAQLLRLPFKGLAAVNPYIP